MIYSQVQLSIQHNKNTSQTYVLMEFIISYFDRCHISYGHASSDEGCGYCMT